MTRRVPSLTLTRLGPFFGFWFCVLAFGWTVGCVPICVAVAAGAGGFLRGESGSGVSSASVFDRCLGFAWTCVHSSGDRMLFSVLSSALYVLRARRGSVVLTMRAEG